MRGSRALKPLSKAVRIFNGVPRPGTLGVFGILVTILAFVAGEIRQELALSLLGAVFSAVWVYCYLSVLVLGLAQKRRARSLAAEIRPALLVAGETAGVVVSGQVRRFFCLPGTIIRYELRLRTRDGRELRHVFNPGGSAGVFPVRERGAYFGPEDEFTVLDALGFCRFSFPLPREHGPRLLAAPSPVEDPLPMPVRLGGSVRRLEPHYRRTEDLSDHRPYVPGDDPRRINWKLYSHGPYAEGQAGELFVRDGDPEPPPHARLTLLLDTQADPRLFTPEEGRRAVDMLCRTALAAALEFSSQGINITLGYTGGGLSGSTESGLPPADAAAALARPAALPLESPEDLPAPPEETGVLLLALPRVSAQSSALDRFITRKDPRREEDLLFLYESGGPRAAEWEEAATLCAAVFGRRQGIRVRTSVIQGRFERPTCRLGGGRSIP